MLLAIMQGVVIVAVALFEYNVGSIGVFLWAMLCVNFAIPHALTVFLSMETYQPWVYNSASLFAIGFSLLYLVMRLLIVRCTKKKRDCFIELNASKEQLNRRKNTELRFEKRFHKYSFLLLSLFFVVFLIYTKSKFGSLLSASWGGYYLEETSVYDASLSLSFVSLLTKYVCFAFGGLCFSYIRRGKVCLGITSALFILIILLLTRNRILILPVATGIITVLIAKHRKLRVKEIVLFSIIACLMIYLVYAFRTFRHAGSFDKLGMVYNSFDEFHQDVLDDILNSDGELWLRNHFYYFLANDNRFPRFNQGHTYLRLLMILLPTRFSLGLKPPDFAISMASAYYGNYANTTSSIHPTLFGDAFANFNWFGIFVGLFWAIMITMLNEAVLRQPMVVQEMLVALLGASLIIIGRGSVYNSCVIILYGYIMIIIVKTLSIIMLRMPFIRLRQ